MISRNEFEVLAYVERNGSAADPVRETINPLLLSRADAEAATARLKDLCYLVSEGGRLSVTEAGLDALSPDRKSVV